MCVVNSQTINRNIVYKLETASFFYYHFPGINNNHHNVQTNRTVFKIQEGIPVSKDTKYVCEMRLNFAHKMCVK